MLYSRLSRDKKERSVRHPTQSVDDVMSVKRQSSSCSSSFCFLEYPSADPYCLNSFFSFLVLAPNICRVSDCDGDPPTTYLQYLISEEPCKVEPAYRHRSSATGPPPERFSYQSSQTQSPVTHLYVRSARHPYTEGPNVYHHPSCASFDVSTRG